MKPLFFILISGLITSTTVCSQPTTVTNLKPVYVCDIKDSVALTDTGFLKPDGYSNAVKDTLKQIIFDENTGIIRGTGKFKLEVVQQKAEGNGLIARREYKGVMTTIIQVLSIRTWQAHIPFTYYDAGRIHSGTCRILN